jgi:Arc/MetJ-type ribon-helix-helix transcriptional regulator
MMIGMTKAKIAITIDEELLAEIKARVEAGEADSVSAYISRALEREEDDPDVVLKREIDKAAALTGGPITEEEREIIRRINAGEVDLELPNADLEAGEDENNWHFHDR